MAHKHLQLQEEHVHGKQVRVSIALLATLAGGILLISSTIAGLIYGSESDHAQFLAMISSLSKKSKLSSFSVSIFILLLSVGFICKVLLNLKH